MCDESNYMKIVDLWICYLCEEGYLNSEGNCGLCDEGYVKIWKESLRCVKDIEYCGEYLEYSEKWICEKCLEGFMIDGDGIV